MKRTRTVPNSSNDVLNSARSVVSSAVVSVTPAAAATTRSGPPSVSVANAPSFTLTVMRPDPMRVVVSTVTSAVARTVSPPLVTRRSVVMRVVSPPAGETVTASLSCTSRPATAIAVCTLSVPGAVESVRTLSSSRVVPSVTNPTSDVTDAVPRATQ